MCSWQIYFPQTSPSQWKQDNFQLWGHRFQGKGLLNGNLSSRQCIEFNQDSLDQNHHQFLWGRFCIQNKSTLRFLGTILQTIERLKTYAFHLQQHWTQTYHNHPGAQYKNIWIHLYICRFKLLGRSRSDLQSPSRIDHHLRLWHRAISLVQESSNRICLPIFHSIRKLPKDFSTGTDRPFFLLCPWF